MLDDETVVVPFGVDEALEFETLKNHTSVRTAKAILGGETYPVIPAVRDVSVVLDTEGCEVPIFESLGDLLPSIKVVYLEFHSEPDRKTIDRMFGATHFLAVGRVLFGQGEMVYVANAIV